MVVLAVIKVSSQSNGNGHHNYVVGMTTHANPCCAATTRVVSANTWLVVYVAMLRFLGFVKQNSNQFLLVANS